MTKGTIYVSGPITGRPELNLPAFRSAEEKIRSLGLRAIVPHDLVEGMHPEKFLWEDYMRVCIRHMMDCEAVVTLDDWEESPGAKIEVRLARELNINVHHIIHVDKIIREVTMELDK